MMNDDQAANRAIDRILTGLREAQPTAGLEQRILEAISRQAPVTRPAWWPTWLTPRRPLAWATASALILVVALATHSIRRATPKAAEPTALPRITASIPSNHDRSPTFHRVHNPPEFAPQPKARAVQFARPPRASSATEIGDPSFPPPPMPLTEQEKLLLRLTHKADPDALAILNPEARQQEEASLRQDFERFFPPPPPPPKPAE